MAHTKIIPFFSIIIPCLNEEHFLPLLLKDLANQNFHNFEIIVVDGKSSDKTPDIASHNSKTTLVVSNKRNVSYQRNLGAKKARGKYLVFFDADSRIPKYYLFQLEKNLTHDNPDICSTMIGLSNNNIISRIIIFFGNLLVYFSTLLKKPLFAGACICISKSCIDKFGGFDEKLKMCEDHELAYRFTKAGAKCKFYINPKYYFSFRRFEHDGYVKVLFQWWLGLMVDLTNNHNIAHLVHYEMGGKRYK